MSIDNMSHTLAIVSDKTHETNLAVKRIEKRLNEDECIKHKVMLFLDSPNDLSSESNLALRKLIGYVKD